MKITDERTTVKVKFEDIDYGDVFKWNDEVFMRIHSIWRHENDEVTANAVYVDNGEEAVFEDNTSVEPLDAELIIKGVSE